MKYLDVKDVMESLGLSRNATYKLFATKGFPCVKVGKKYIIEQDDLKSFLDNYRGREIKLG